MSQTHTYHLQLPRELLDKFDSLCKRYGMKKSECAGKAFAFVLNQEEWIQHFMLFGEAFDGPILIAYAKMFEIFAKGLKKRAKSSDDVAARAKLWPRSSEDATVTR